MLAIDLSVPQVRALRLLVGVLDEARACYQFTGGFAAVLSSPDDREAEAQALFEEFCDEFDGTHRYSYQGIEPDFVRQARRQVEDLRDRAAGKPAPDRDGTDLDGRRLRLSDYRGRVVLLNFWGTWCFPCMKLVPHERELAERFAGRPFAVVGVNCDDDLEKARAAVTRTKMTWPSFRNRAGDAPAITATWKVLGYPSLYLIDHHGTIRKRWVGSPTPQELVHAAGVLVGAAEKKVAPGSMKPVVAALRPPLEKPAAREPPPALPGTGFVDWVFRPDEKEEARYVVFLPRDYDGEKAFPALLSLHGAGPRGTDGRRHVRHGLARVIRERGEDFPFVVVFPQAREGEDWRAGGAGAARALAILDRVLADYKVDPERVSLTGVSMGGEGAWGLAAAHPRRWAAVVPICHGADLKLAPKLKGVPIWCFHGDADRMIPVRQSREMVRAVKEAGGRPL